MTVVAIVVVTLLAAGVLAYVGYPWWCRRVVTRAEAGAVLPGDELVPDPTTGYTLATTIAAPPSAIWPWLVQIGQGRGGFYTHEWVERALEADIHNVDYLVSELQHLEVGDRIRLTPDPYLGRPGQSLVVARADRNRALVLAQQLPSGGTGTWAFVLEPIANNATRLVFRRRGTQPSRFDRIALPGYYYMDRGMLAGLRKRAEHASARPPPQRATTVHA
ncbi:MAG TPA: hypothetical protein VFQ53_08905 [Kofleriaceae bacterium]|nr:hypothetical protein [Kofleriaceae bacterium]